MSNFPLPLLENETILKQDGKALYIKHTLGTGYHVLRGQLWLTTARLVHQDFPLARLTTYPLAHITQAVHESVRVSEKRFEIKDVYTSWKSYNSALRLTFDNGGSDYFIPQEIDAWAQAVTQAVPTAPALDYTNTPPLRPSLAADAQAESTPEANTATRLFWIVAGVVLCLLCGAAICVGFPFLLAFFSTGDTGGHIQRLMML